MQVKKTTGLILSLAIMLAFAACSRKPVLYDNAKLNKVGRSKANSDIDECFKKAKNAGAAGEGKVAKAGMEAARTGTASAAASAAGTAVLGGSVGRGAAAGGAAGAAGGFVWRLFDRGPDPIVRGYVETCLRERGYKPIGWN